MFNRPLLFLLTSCALGVLVSGCGGSGKLQTRGRILKNGAPYVPPDGDIVRVMFVPIADGKGKVTDFHMANFNPEDGTFQAAGKDLKGVPPGKYRIAIEHLHRRADIFKGTFDAERSPFVHEINSSTGEIVIDVAKAK
jgi:hypothetical protein